MKAYILKERESIQDLVAAKLLELSHPILFAVSMEIIAEQGTTRDPFL